MGTLKLCPMWDIYGERRNLLQEMDLEKFVLVKNSILTHSTPKLKESKYPEI